MSVDPVAQFLLQLDSVVSEFEEVTAGSSRSLNNVPPGDIERIITLGRAAVARIAGRKSVYMEQVDAVLVRDGIWEWERLRLVVGIVLSLRSDLEKGHLRSYEELVHAELFGNFLEMSEHLLDGGYKDAAAVVAGSTLEEHLRQMCKSHSIATTVRSSGKTRPKKADAMNAELKSASAYSGLDHKNVTAWLDLRNKAAHGHYSEYSKEQVVLMLSGIGDFMARNPA